MRTYFKFLSRNRMYTAINVFGLSISLTFVIIIALYTQHERNMDSIHTKAGRIYALAYNDGGTPSEGSHWKIQDKLKSRYPEVETTCAIAGQDVILKTGSDENVTKKALFADSTFFRMFDFELLQGDRRTVLDAPNSVVLTEETARLLFGQTNPVGKNVLLNDTLSLCVTGVMSRMENSCIGKDIDMIVRFENIHIYNWSLTDDYMSNAVGSSVFILTKPGTDLTAKEKDMDEYFRTFFWFYQRAGVDTKTVLIPLRDLYLSGSFCSCGATARGDNRLTGILFSVALVILLFSVMNYVNLTVAQSGFRAREMAMRRLLGSRREGIIGRLVAESIVLCALSMAVAMVLSYVLMPYAAQLLASDVTMSAMLQPLNIALAMLGVLLIGVLAGAFPAIVISAAKPIEVVRGTFRRRTKMVFSKAFIIIQNAITIILVAVSLTMSMQVRHLIDAPLGYDPTNLIVIRDIGDNHQEELFMSRVRALPCVTAASASMGPPLFRGNNSTMQYEGKTISFQIFVADTAYMRTIGLKLMQDNGNASSEGRVYVNRQALAEEGLGLDAKTIKYYDQTFTINGIVDDFKIGTILSDQHPVMLFINGKTNMSWMFTIRYTGDGEEALARIRDIHKEIYHMDISYDRGMPFYDNCIKEEFRQYIRISRIVGLFTFVAIVISLLGLLAMSTYFIQQRRREIAVRKVFGSTNGEILVRLLRTFIAYVLVAFVIATPVIYHFMTDWLSQFSYRIALSPWIFIAAGAFCLVISVVTVFFQSWQAANMNPVESIKEN